ncbi:Aldose 1-epimerase [Stanieria cyanosphaera PCC 7437]|uniref:Aldose 1-epimerase n=1 Tax=Stanieria cyanosphaera (strain ATCC 29371 / PCC 7437) TaxID=111780 RepID=K9XV03_STAC7|nr:aldose 1-epimerase [Stanieria cyanosphaera]AFZ35492.1 Aldose 1-epimerase [Stanieria cyanosphaera PCC 7437]
MFEITQKQEQYQTYVMTDVQAQSQIEVVPERGAIITRWRVKEEEILYLDQERFTHPELSIRGGIPILFPICGNLPNNSYTYQNQTYQLKQHGFARDLPWKVIETNDHDCASMTLALQSDEQTLMVYPFEFEITFTYQLKRNSLRILQTYHNQSEAIMPFATGLHPYFQVEAKNQLQFEIPATFYQDQVSKETYPFKGKFDFTQAEIDVAFTQIDKHHTAIADLNKNHKISINYSDCYSTLVFWTIKGKDYVCLEPWTAPRNALNTQEKLICLEPGNTFDSVVEINLSYF